MRRQVIDGMLTQTGLERSLRNGSHQTCEKIRDRTCSALWGVIRNRSAQRAQQIAPRIVLRAPLNTSRSATAAASEQSSHAQRGSNRQNWPIQLSANSYCSFASLSLGSVAKWISRPSLRRSGLAKKPDSSSAANIVHSNALALGKSTT